MMRFSPLVAALMVCSSVESSLAFNRRHFFCARRTDANINIMLSATSTDSVKTVSRHNVLIANTAAVVMVTLPLPAQARLKGVNRPDLLIQRKTL
jgi:hypothetical protein